MKAERIIRVVASQELDSQFVRVVFSVEAPRKDLSEVHVYTAPIKDIEYPGSGRKYLFPTVKGGRFDAREGTYFVAVIYANHSRKYYKTYVILGRVKQGASITHEDYTIQNAELVKKITRKDLEEARLEMLNKGYSISKNYEMRNLASQILLDTITQ